MQSNEDLVADLAELRRMIIEQQAQLKELKGQLVVDPIPVPPDPRQSSRRKLLKRLTIGLATGVAGVVAATSVTEAKYTINPTGQSGRIGATLTPLTGGSIVGTLPNGSTKIGLIAYSGTANLNLADLPSSDAALYGNAPSGNGVYGNSSSGVGVFGNSSSWVGVFGKSNSWIGVFGSSNSSIGVCGNSNSDIAVYGNSVLSIGVEGSGTVGGSFGSSAISTGTLPATTRVGLLGIAGENLDLATFSPNQSIGIYAKASNAQFNYAGLFNGNVLVVGTLSKGGGSFKIDHPLDPENKYLYHSFVESPDMLNIYNGTAELNSEGVATVELPAYFEALNKDYRYQLTSIGVASPNLHISQEVSGNRFGIAGGQPSQKVSWQVTGIRQDAWANANRIPVEEDKPDYDKGFYLYPEAHGKESKKGIGMVRNSAKST